VDIGGISAGTGTVSDLIDAVELAATIGSPFPFTLPLTIPSGPGSNNIDLSDLFGGGGVLNDYPGLEFRSVPAYLYVNGPARLFQNGNVSMKLEFKDSSSSLLASFDKTVAPLVLPSLPPSGTLSPKPAALPLAGIFNQQPDGLTAAIDFTVGTITLNSLSELRAFADELRTPLTAHLVLLLPFQFTASSPIPVLAGPDPANPPANSPPNPAIALVDGGADLLGRGSGGDGAMEDIMENLQSLGMEISIVNNLGINGYIKMLPKMPIVYDPAVNPTAEGLGTIKLSGKSTVTIPRDKLEDVPFSPALEIYLNGDFDIKRSLPTEGAMTMSMAVILRTDIDMTF
jgi:hypothetical protein